ncbi:MAG: agmatine deiminase family protein [Planctomycetes bacterium]|nr:agmatine deiminase family protein [Planctomycetota bacterium]
MRIGWLLPWCLVACATAPSAPARRVVAEWEPALGTLVAHPFAVPGELLRELAAAGRLFVLVARDATIQQRAAAEVRVAGVPDEQVTWIPTTTQTAWTRDYGPHTVDLADGSRLLVDADYVETPIFRRDAPPVALGDELRYPGRSPGDDRSPQEVAMALGLPREPIAAFVTGGNFLVDGLGTAFCTTALLDENRTRMSDELLRQRLLDQLGIERLIVLENTEPIGIQHIDCWLKVIDPHTLLIKHVAATDPEHAPIERNVASLQAMVAGDGQPFRIVRVDCPPYGRGRAEGGGGEIDLIPAYTNSLILNRQVFVPLFGGPGDAAALAVWQQLLPGHRVVGVRDRSWKPFDALHCRTRAVFAAPTAIESGVGS